MLFRLFKEKQVIHYKFIFDKDFSYDIGVLSFCKMSDLKALC